MLRFQKFPIYLEVRKFVKDIYILSNKLPKAENQGLISQLRRAVVSIMLNIAEGSMKKSDKDFNRFIMISIGSTGEIVAILDLSLDLNYISSSTYDDYMLKCESIIKQLYGFSNFLNTVKK